MTILEQLLIGANALVAEMEVSMPITVVLAVGLDPWLLAAQGPAWRSAGYILVTATSIREAIDRFQGGDFDLVLLGKFISLEDQQRLTLLIRAAGSQTPIVSISNAPGSHDLFADATVDGDPSALLEGMGELLVERSRMRAGSVPYDTAN